MVVEKISPLMDGPREADHDETFETGGLSWLLKCTLQSLFMPDDG
jgi:hypothetical protein